MFFLWVLLGSAGFWLVFIFKWFWKGFGAVLRGLWEGFGRVLEGLAEVLESLVASWTLGAL